MPGYFTRLLDSLFLQFSRLLPHLNGVAEMCDLQFNGRLVTDAQAKAARLGGTELHRINEIAQMYVGGISLVQSYAAKVKEAELELKAYTEDPL